ncbi:MAG: hypothetical protein RL591_67, partial [Planctomycetota bacterium]
TQAESADDVSDDVSNDEMDADDEGESWRRAA